MQERCRLKGLRPYRKDSGHALGPQLKDRRKHEKVSRPLRQKVEGKGIGHHNKRGGGVRAEGTGRASEKEERRAER